MASSVSCRFAQQAHHEVLNDEIDRISSPVPDLDGLRMAVRRGEAVIGALDLSVTCGRILVARCTQQDGLTQKWVDTAAKGNKTILGLCTECPEFSSLKPTLQRALVQKAVEFLSGRSDIYAYAACDEKDVPMYKDLKFSVEKISQNIAKFCSNNRSHICLYPPLPHEVQG